VSRDAPLLQRKLLIWLLVPLLALFLSAGIAGYVIARNLSNDVYDRELLEIAHELAVHVVERGGALRLDLPPASERALLLDQYDEVWYRVATADGVTVAGDPALPAPPGSSAGARDPLFYDGRLDGRDVWVVLTRVALSSGTRQSEALVQVAETGVKRSLLIRRIVLSIVLPQVLLIVIAALLVWVGVAQGLSPLRRLRQAVANRSHLDLSPIAEQGVPGEVRPLLHAINELMVRLNEVLSLQARFIADAAHQLRTPVAGLKANIEVGLRETEPAAMKRALAQVFVGVERLSRLVSQLLSLARNEPNYARSVNFAQIDLNRLVSGVTMEWVPEAYKKGIDLGLDGVEQPVMIAGDAMRLTELANNLLDNAIRYTSPGGRVTVRVAGEPQPAFSISDDGPRIPPEERERIFKRFHRLLGAPAQGSGLGLAIVREIAVIHGAEVSLTDDSDGIGNRFTVVFPRAGSDPARVGL